MSMTASLSSLWEVQHKHCLTWISVWGPPISSGLLAPTGAPFSFLLGSAPSGEWPHSRALLLIFSIKTSNPASFFSSHAGGKIWQTNSPFEGGDQELFMRLDDKTEAQKVWTTYSMVHSVLDKTHDFLLLTCLVILLYGLNTKISMNPEL